MKATCNILVCLLSALLPVSAAAAGAEAVATTTMKGDYQVAWLTLEKGGVSISDRKLEPIDVPLFLGLRDCKAVAAWFAHPAMTGARIVWLDRSTLQLEGGVLKGELAGRTNLNWGSKTVHDYRYAVDARVSGDRIEGTFTASYAGDDGSKADLRGKLSGRLMTAKQAQIEQAFPAGKNWPHYHGDGSAFAGPSCGAKLIDDLAQARPVWKSEAFIPTAYGSAPDSRYYNRAGRTDNGGGSSSPVVFEGRVYQFYYYPRGPVGLDRAYLKYTDEADLAARAKELFPKREVQQRALVNHFRTQADEFLVCLDAATGQLLWKTVLPQRGNNYQTHKHRGHFPVPLVEGGVVYQPGTTGRLYAIDAGSGKLRWEYPDADPQPYVTKQGGIDCHAPSPVLVGNVLIFAAGKGVTGVDVKTGKKQWEQPLWTRSSLLPWKGPTRTLVIATDRSHEKKTDFAVALDPESGKVVWRQPIDYLMGFGFPLLAGDMLVGYRLKMENIKPGQNDGLAIVTAYQVSEKGLEKAWATPPLAPIIDTVGLVIQGGRVYVSTAAETFCLSLERGEKLASVKDVGGARTQTALVADGRLLIQPEGRHGKQSFFLLDADPKNFRVLGQPARPWLPPHSWTTAYANQPITYPLVDGRLFVRGLEAIYCYDLRKLPR